MGNGHLHDLLHYSSEPSKAQINLGGPAWDLHVQCALKSGADHDDE